MQLTRKMDSFNDLWAIITLIGDSSNVEHILNVNLLCLTVKSIWNAYVSTMKRYQQSNLTEPVFTPSCVLSLLDCYWIELCKEIKGYTRILHIIIVRERFSDLRIPGIRPINERMHALMNKPALRFYFKPYDLTQSQAQAYHDKWTKTDIVSIEQTQNGKLRLKLTPPSWH